MLRITRVICANYRRHLSELPSPPPQVRFESSSSPRLQKLCIHTSGGIIRTVYN